MLLRYIFPVIVLLFFLSFCFYHQQLNIGEGNYLTLNGGGGKQSSSSSLGKLEAAKRYVATVEKWIETTINTNVTKPPITFAAADPLSIAIDPSSTATPPPSLSPWSDQLISKIHCLKGIYLYHIRKAAGTTVRDILTTASMQSKIPFYETEGLTLNCLFLEDKQLLLVTSLRHPIKRAISMYWYEHVGWFDGVKKETNKCKTLKMWITSWRDGSEWKNNFMLKNPRNVYVEIQNYYVKALSGWVGPEAVGEEDYEKAKGVLKSFDVVYVTEWMSNENQSRAMSSLFSAIQQVQRKGDGAAQKKSVYKLEERENADVVAHLGHQVEGDASARKRLAPLLAPDEVRERKRNQNIIQCYVM